MDLSEKEARKILDSLEFKDDLITAVVRDVKDKEVLMVAFMNEEAVMKTLTTGLAHFWSRSRAELWEKGEESGHYQKIQEVRVDCDGDALLLDVKPEGPSCHKGYRSCFYRKVEGGNLSKTEEKEFDPDEVYE